MKLIRQTSIQKIGERGNQIAIPKECTSILKWENMKELMIPICRLQLDIEFENVEEDEEQSEDSTKLST